jgi:hypothetical protein
MRVLEGAASTYHRSRAGATYSVVKRLVAFGLIRQERGQLEVSHEGVSSLRDWLSGPIPPTDLAHSADLVRLRLHFLGALAPDERSRLIDQAIEGLEALEAELVSLIGANQSAGEFFGALAAAGSILETRARIRWLTLIRPLVGSPLGEDVDWTELLLAQLEASPPPKE